MVENDFGGVIEKDSDAVVVEQVAQPVFLGIVNELLHEDFVADVDWLFGDVGLLGIEVVLGVQARNVLLAVLNAFHKH